MIKNFTAKYTNIKAGYMGQIIEWPEVITEGKNIEDCRLNLRDALEQMVLAYRDQNKEIPIANALIEQLPVEFGDVSKAA